MCLSQGKRRGDLAEQQRCPVAVLDVGGVDQGMDQIAAGVGDDMPLAALDLRFDKLSNHY